MRAQPPLAAMSGANPFARFREVKSRSNRDVKPVLKSEPPAAKEPEQLQPSLPVSASPQFTDGEWPGLTCVRVGLCPCTIILGPPVSNPRS